jgi:hypothetical protein
LDGKLLRAIVAEGLAKVEKAGMESALREEFNLG